MTIDRLRARLRALFLRTRLEREMQDEMAHHIEQATLLLMRQGMSRREAQRQANRDFGNVVWLQEEARNARSTWIDGVVADCRFALRHFRRNKGTCLVLLSVLALGISINVALFSIAHSYATQPRQGIPLEDDLVRIRGVQTTEMRDDRISRRFSRAELDAYRQLTRQFAEVTGWVNAPASLDAEDEQRGLSARVVLVTENYFSTLGIAPVIGSGFTAATGDEPVTIIADATWERLYGRSPDALGKPLVINGMSFTIGGVAPPRFKGVDGSFDDDLIAWIPLRHQRSLIPEVPPEEEVFGAAARLRPGVTREAASAAVNAVARRTGAAETRPLVISGMRLVPGETVARIASSEVVPLLSQSGDPNSERDTRAILAASGVLGLLVLLVTCTNVSALLTGLALARRKEIAARLSLGASRTRLVRQLITESLLLAMAAAVMALVVIWAAATAAVAFIPQLEFEIRVSGPAALFAFMVSLMVGFLFGLSPALHATRIAIGDALKDSATTVAAIRARLQRSLVVLQIAFTQPLIVGLVGMLILISGDLSRGRPTETAENVISLALQPTSPGVSQAMMLDPAVEQRSRSDMLSLQQRLLAIPGVMAVVPTYSMVRGFGGVTVHSADQVAGGVSDLTMLTGPVVAAGHFSVSGVPILRGREFQPHDAANEGDVDRETPVIVGSDVAERYWPGVDPIGRRLRTGGSPRQDPINFVVVGVFEQRRSEGFVGGIPMSGYDFYLPAHADSPPPSSLLIRATVPGTVLIPAVRRAVREEAPSLAIRSIRTLADIQREARAQFRLATSALGTATALVFFLAAIGLYSVVRFASEQRAGEIAVRLAVGAQARQITRLFVADGLRLGGLGLLLGLPLSLIALRSIASADLDFRQIPVVPVAAVASFGILVIAAGATWFPASRAADVGAAAVLRRG